MRKTAVILGCMLLIFIGIVPVSQAQFLQPGQSAIFVNGGYSHPLGTLAERFKGTYNVDAGYLYGLSTNMSAEIRVVYGKFDKLTDDPTPYTQEVNNIPTAFTIPPELEHWYRYVGLTPSLMLGLGSSSVKPYIVFGTGVYRYDWYRGPARAYVRWNNAGDWQTFRDPLTGQMIAPYASKHITQWQWGLNGGAGIAFPIAANAVIDIRARYEAILGDIWATLYMGMEEVRPIQNLQLTGGIKFMF